MRLDAVPVTVTVAFAAAAVPAAVSVIFCAVPGVSVRLEGLAVTPEGSPLSDTFTEPAKPFSADAFTENACPIAPAVSARLAGDVVKEKSGVVTDEAAATVSAKVAVCVSDPETAVTVTVACEAAALDAAANVMLCAAPGARASVAGVAVTPPGSPANDTETFPVKPFAAVAVTEMVPGFAPAVTLRLELERASEKSGDGAVVVVPEPEDGAVA